MDPNLTSEEVLKSILQRLEALEVRRVYQWDIAPAVVKNRHMGEPNSFFVAGLAADRPTDGSTTTGGVTYYFATDTFVLSVWTGTAWKSVTLS